MPEKIKRNNIQIIGMNLSELEDLSEKFDQSRFRGRQLFNSVYKQKINAFDNMKTLPTSFRDILLEKYVLHPLSLVKKIGSDLESTEKYLFQLSTGEKIESVLMYEDKRVTLCVSTQVGCAVDCKFCATAKMGFSKNLTAGEIIDQYLIISNSINKRITNIVFMGMGEPFLNYKQVINAAKLFNNRSGINLSSQRITISTVGIIPKIKQYSEEGHKYKLAISLNSNHQSQRVQIMPISKIHSINDLIKSVWYYHKNSKRLATFEYVLMENVNDSSSDAERLINLIGDLPCKINLIPYNEIDGPFKRPSDERIKRFVKAIKNTNFIVTVRWSKGTDINSGCGQLAILES